MHFLLVLKPAISRHPKPYRIGPENKDLFFSSEQIELFIKFNPVEGEDLNDEEDNELCSGFPVQDEVLRELRV